MKRSRYRDDPASSGHSLVLGVAAALAGIAIGVLIAHRMGGLKGIKARFKKRFGRGGGGVDLERLREFADEAFADEDDLGEDLLDTLEHDAHDAAAAALEEKVLAAFVTDELFRERPVDISAKDSAVVELTGWVRSKAERMRATAIARKVPGVITVVNELLVGDPETIDAGELTKSGE
jgi:hypothetical protein